MFLTWSIFALTFPCPTSKMSNKTERRLSSDSSSEDDTKDLGNRISKAGPSKRKGNIVKPGICNSKNIDLDEPSASSRKRKATPEPDYGPAKRMMKKWGFEEGKGLGSAQQGRIEPVQAVTTKGKRGLGTKHPEGLEPGPVDWELEEIVYDEKLEWIAQLEENEPFFSIELLRGWLKIGEKKYKIDDETNFVDPTTLAEILRCKDLLDTMEGNELMRARSRSNPFETIRKGIFINRAAMKMANMDAILNFELTDPKTREGVKLLKPKGLLYFADICAGPGGFSEYVLWKKKWFAKGFGFTLRGDCDFKLENFVSGPPESFEPYYGVRGDGDIYCPENVKSFADYVLSNTDGAGVHFVMADGGFSVEGQENIQELLSKQLYLSQFLDAMSIVREGGHFVCKLFDVFTPFSVGLVYLMYLSFDFVSLLKPNTSRPANSERYLVCKWKKEGCGTGEIFEYLKECHDRMWAWSLDPTQKSKDIIELVPMDIIRDKDDEFFNYVLNSNNENGKLQIQNLKKIHAFFRDENLKDHRQREVREECLKRWEIPTFISSTNFGAINQFMNILPRFEEGSELRRSNIENAFNPRLTWKFTVLEGKRNKRNTGFYRRVGRSNVERLEGNFWRSLQHEKIELSQDTLVYGEIVYELQGQMPNQTRSAAFHIIDGFVLGGIDISAESFLERQTSCATFAKAMHKPASGLFVRSKPFFRLDEMSEFLENIKWEVVKGEGKRERIVCPINYKVQNLAFIQPSSILFLNISQDILPWTTCLSTRNNLEYWFNTKNNTSQFEIPPNAVIDSSGTIRTRINWWWDEYTKFHRSLSPGGTSYEEDGSDRLHIPDFLQYIATS